MMESGAKLRTVIAALSLLLLGAALGIAGDRMMHRSRQFPHVVVARFDGDALTLMDDEIALTQEQRDRIRNILRTHQPAVDSAWVRARSEVQVTVDGVVAEIASVLDSTQLDRFYELVAKVHGAKHVRILRHGSQE